MPRIDARRPARSQPWLRRTRAGAGRKRAARVASTGRRRRSESRGRERGGAAPGRTAGERDMAATRSDQDLGATVCTGCSRPQPLPSQCQLPGAANGPATRPCRNARTPRGPVSPSHVLIALAGRPCCATRKADESGAELMCCGVPIESVPAEGARALGWTPWQGRRGAATARADIDAGIEPVVAAGRASRGERRGSTGGSRGTGRIRRATRAASVLLREVRQLLCA